MTTAKMIDASTHRLSISLVKPAPGIGAVVILQLLFTYAPPLQRLFDNAAIPLRIWPWLLLGGLVFFLLVEAEKLIIRSSGSLRSAVIAVEAGA
jgi:Cation transporting ATPase, C-terminus